MKYKSWVLDILSIVRNAANSPNKSGLIIIVMILVIAFLILYIIDKNKKIDIILHKYLNHLENLLFAFASKEWNFKFCLTYY